MNKEKALVKNTFILSIGTFLPMFSSIITLPIITGGLSKAEMGTYDLIKHSCFIVFAYSNIANSVRCISIFN